MAFGEQGCGGEVDPLVVIDRIARWTREQERKEPESASRDRSPSTTRPAGEGAPAGEVASTDSCSATTAKSRLPDRQGTPPACLSVAAHSGAQRSVSETYGLRRRSCVRATSPPAICCADASPGSIRRPTPDARLTLLRTGLSTHPLSLHSLVRVSGVEPHQWAEVGCRGAEMRGDGLAQSQEAAEVGSAAPVNLPTHECVRP